MADDLKKQQAEAEAMIKAVYDDKLATINGRDYKFTLTSHQQRLKVFAFFTKVQNELQRGDFSFLDTKEWLDVERTIGNIVTYDGHLLSRRNNGLHWEEFPEDFLTFISTAMPVISYPFLRGKSAV